MYLDDPEPLVDALCKLTRPSGLVSIVAKNVAVMALRHAHEGDWTAAIAAFDSERTRRRHPRRPHRPPVSADRSARRRTRRVVWRASLHGRLDPRRAATDPEDLVLQAELMASQRDPYRQLSRLFQLVGRRPA
jgi:S-adenosylmethionine-dependent methyltransferase